MIDRDAAATRAGRPRERRTKMRRTIGWALTLLLLAAALPALAYDGPVEFLGE